MGELTVKVRTPRSLTKNHPMVSNHHISGTFTPTLRWLRRRGVLLLVALFFLAGTARAAQAEPNFCPDVTGFYRPIVDKLVSLSRGKPKNLKDIMRAIMGGKRGPVTEDEMYKKLFAGPATGLG